MPTHIAAVSTAHPSLQLTDDHLNDLSIWLAGLGPVRTALHLPALRRGQYSTCHRPDLLVVSVGSTSVPQKHQTPLTSYLAIRSHVILRLPDPEDLESFLGQFIRHCTASPGLSIQGQYSGLLGRSRVGKAVAMCRRNVPVIYFIKHRLQAP
jgi:hypothetical protein